MRLIFTIFLLLVNGQCHADDDQDQINNNTHYIIMRVYDGDTVQLRPIDSTNKKIAFKLRLTDIDAPEREQAYGLKSRQALVTLCQFRNSIVTARIAGKDKYQRSLGRLHCNGTDVSVYMAEQGWAWHYAQYSNDAEIYNAAMRARQLRVGLWADDNPIAPWIWRRTHKHQQQHFQWIKPIFSNRNNYF